MSKYIGSEEKVVKAGEKINFENLSKSPVTVGTAVMFNKDGVYICDILNGRVSVTNGESATPPHGDWVSCDERLPEEKGEYLVTYHPCYWDSVSKEIMVGIDTFRGKTKWAKSKYQRVIAWMPKPKPYIERKETE